MRDGLEIDHLLGDSAVIELRKSGFIFAANRFHGQATGDSHYGGEIA